MSDLILLSKINEVVYAKNGTIPNNITTVTNCSIGTTQDNAPNVILHQIAL